MSEVDLYAVEAKFNTAKDEYISIMNSVKTACLGKEKMKKKCQKAAELNADMKTYLLQMSNLTKKTIVNIPKQHELLSVSNQLDKDMNLLITEITQKEDSETVATMNYNTTLPWLLSAITVFSIIVYQWK
jgi:hypothetical protein